MAIVWNSTVRKSVGIDMPIPKGYNVVVGFGVCTDSSDPKLVKVSVDENSSMWAVEVFTLSTRVWKTVYTGVPFKSGDFCSRWFQVFVNGVIYVRACDDKSLDYGVRSNFVISFDLESEKFGEVCFPEKLVRAPFLDVANVDESLGLLEYYFEGEIPVCDVWTRKDGANKTFNKIYTVKVEGKWFRFVSGFRNNGDVAITVDGNDDDNYEGSRIEVYEPLSGHTNGFGIHEKSFMFTARSYVETLLLLDESDSIIH